MRILNFVLVTIVGAMVISYLGTNAQIFPGVLDFAKSAGMFAIGVAQSALSWAATWVRAI